MAINDHGNQSLTNKVEGNFDNRFHLNNYGYDFTFLFRLLYISELKIGGDEWMSKLIK